MKYFPIVLILFTLSACSNINYPKNTDSLSITKYTDPCMSSKPEYKVTILGNGSITYIGYNHVNITGIRYSKIPTSDVSSLLDEFYRLNFFSLKDNYKDTWLMSVSDACATTITISFDDYEKNVYNYYGAPKKFEIISDKIDSIANTEIWIKGSDS